MPDIRVADRLISLDRIDVHDHAALFFQTTEERDGWLSNLVRTACRRDEACVFITKRQYEEGVRSILVKAGLKRECLMKEGRISLIDPFEQFQGYTGTAALMLDVIGAAVDSLLDKGFTAVRLFNDMDRLSEVLPFEETVMFESLSNELYDEKNALGVCFVDASTPQPNIMSAISTHPMLIIKGCTCRNHFFIPPEEHFRLHGGSPETSFILDKLLEIQMSEAVTESSEEDLKGLNARLQGEIGRRQMVEWALLRSENDYRSALNAISDMMLVTDGSNRVLIANSAFFDGLDIIGYDGNIIGQDLYEIMPFLKDGRPSDLHSAMKSGAPSMKESTFEINGRQLTFEISTVPISEGEVVGRVLTTIRNVTGREEGKLGGPFTGDLTEIIMDQAREIAILRERLTFEHERRQLAEGRILSVFRTLDTSKTAMFVWNGEKRIVYANPSCSKYIGYGSGSLDGMGLDDILVDEGHDDRGTLARALQDGTETTFYAKVRMNGGAVRESAITIMRIDDSGSYVLAIVTDGAPLDLGH